MTQRNYGIDLLRLVLMFMVGVLHTLGQGGILQMSPKVGGEHLWLIEIIAYCAVDGFALISGYVSQNKAPNYVRLVAMWMQVFFYSFIIPLILMSLGVGKLSLIEMIKNFLPLTFGRYWYFNAYVVLYLSLPLLNKFLFSLDKEKGEKWLIGLIVLFSIIGLVNDSFKTDHGYSPIWIIVLYLVGHLIRKVDLFSRWKNFYLLLLACFGTLVTFAFHTIIGVDRLMSYLSPTIMLNAIVLVIVFSRIKIHNSHVLRKLSPLAFGIYLFQLSPIVWDTVLKNRFTFVATEGFLQSLVWVLLFSSLIFISGLIVEWLRTILFKLLKLNKLSVLFVKLIERMIGMLNKVI